MKINQSFLCSYGYTGIERKNYSTTPVASQKIQTEGKVYSYPAIYFTGKFNPAKFVPSKINLASEKEKLVKQFDDILKNDITEQEMTKEEKLLQDLNRVTGFENWKNKKLDELDNQILILWEQILTMKSNGISAQSILNARNALVKECRKIERMTSFPPKKTKPQNPQDAKTDFGLINKFKSAVLDDNFDLKRVYIEHYQGLNEVRTIRELKQRYPKISVPPNPKEVVSKKIEGSLTRDFYEELDRVHKSGDKDAFKETITGKVRSILSEQLKKSTDEEKKEIHRKLLDTTVSLIGKKFRKYKESDSISSIPVSRKVKQPLISPTDRKLLTLDYNDFVLSTVREQYLDMKKPNDIVYTYNKGKPGKRKEHTLKVSELRDSEYKFPKISDRMRTLLGLGEELKLTQRNYDYFTKEDFIQRLVFHADRQDENEAFLSTLMNFGACRFEGEDVDMLKRFLREADDVLDGKKSMKEAVEYIDRNRISPRETERINETERKERIDAYKKEQKAHAELKHIQSKFDDNINILYLNDMAYSADLCSAFRPTSLDPNQKVKADEISKIIRKYQDKDEPLIITNKDRMAAELTRWKKYNDYSKDHINDALLEKAREYAKDKKGNIDYDKAGQYIINYEAVETYPQSFEYARNRKAAEKIMKNFSDNKDKAVAYLCKYDDYLDLSEVEKSKISNILKIFDKKDSMDKSMLKDIIEDEYIKTPTTEWALMTEGGSKKVKATIAPKAKEEIMDHYKFPKCLDYFDMFEYALPQFAADRNSAGIKKIDKNFYELKITGHDDRILAKNGNYYFDKFDPVGLH